MNLVGEAGERDPPRDEKRHAMPLRLLAEELSKEEKLEPYRALMATETGDQFDEEVHRQTSEPPAKLDIDAVHSGDHLRTLVNERSQMPDQFPVFERLLKKRGR